MGMVSKSFIKVDWQIQVKGYMFGVGLDMVDKEIF